MLVAFDFAALVTLTKIPRFDVMTYYMKKKKSGREMKVMSTE